MSLKDDLIATKALIDTPEKWRKDGEVEFSSCCAIVAINRASNMYRLGTSRADMRRALGRQLNKPWSVFALGDNSGEAIARFNDADATTHADVMALFDRAIAAAGDA